MRGRAAGAMVRVLPVLGCLLVLTGSSSESKLKAPELNIKGKEHVIQAEQTLHLMCRGDARHAWTLPEAFNNSNKRLSIVRYACGRKGKHYCSSLTLSRAEAGDTGYYSCRYSSSTLAKKNKMATHIYIFINDTTHPFVETHSEIPHVVYTSEGKQLVIPCRVTAPNITVTLKKFLAETLIPDGKTVIWDSKKGFVIPKATFKFIGLLICEASINGHVHSTKYMTHRQVNEIHNVWLNGLNPIKLLRGERLALNCTVRAAWNSRVEIKWRYPAKESERVSIIQRINQRKDNIIYSSLVIEKVRDIDKGLYVCLVKSGPQEVSVNTTVHTYEKPFIKVKNRRQGALEVVAGQKSYRLAMKVKAFPPPEVLWYKDDLLAAEKCARYIVNDYVLTIKDVSEEDAGSYTIVLKIPQWNLTKTLTSRLTVNVKPQIYEKAVSFQDPSLYPLGSKQTLTCTVYGVPPPTIKWIWQPCGHNYSRPWCDFRSGAERNSFLLNSGSSKGNPISISERIQIIEGKNKTAGILVVAESKSSGVYSCVATNKIGKDRRNINFYVTDVPQGFHISLDQAPTEGDDIAVSCTVNKYLYTDISWLLQKTVQNRTISHAVRGQRDSVTGEYSITRTFLIKNASQEDSGTYVCRARNVYTKEEVKQRKDITIRALEAPHLLLELHDQRVNKSSTMALDCAAEGIPRPQVSWYKNNQEIHKEPGIALGPDSNRLIIERVKEDDEGLYQCIVSNQRGSVESSAYVTVQGPSERANLELITLTCTCVVATLFWLLLTLFIRKLKRPVSAAAKTDYLSIIMDPEEVPLDEQCDRLPYDASKWEFPMERLQLGKSLGWGAFGKVVQASAFGMKRSPTCTTVAVKMLKEGATASEYKALMTELKILIHIGHHLNVVNLLGACTRPGGPLMVIVEYCKYGNLSIYLKSKRGFFCSKGSAFQPEQMKEKRDQSQAEAEKLRLHSVTSSESSSSSGNEVDKSLSDVEEEEADAGDFYRRPITMEDLISYSFQVARGMEFLSSRKCIHRDLAARNILLSENNVVKICDFGLARDIYKDPDYVRKGDARLPLKWMAPESIFDKIYTTKSDVWSYGVLLWEIFSLGASPYPGVQIDEEFCNRLKEGTRMRAPNYATPDIYQAMLDCWDGDPKERPRFSDLVEQLGDLLQASVRQDGIDYIPVNTVLAPSSACVSCNPTSTDCCVEGGSVTIRFSCQSFENCRYINTYKLKQPQRVKTFEELSPKDPSVFEDYRADMVLASEECKRFTWTGSKPKHVQFQGFKGVSRSKESMFSPGPPRRHAYNASCSHLTEALHRPCHDVAVQEERTPLCSPPPDYNSVISYTSSPV
ncbi:vascular endothelial growth factor receptor 1 [Ambystoma mexicanum]|uniref:vascular endothelial growth factor receptor 1 n=1 Tax=Ambystoma mexicanum TaxID=8296 RepID=UPI0037E70464